MAITLTAAAADQIKKYLANDGKNIGLRLGIKSSGCSGFSYAVGMADQVSPEDHVYEQHGVKVIVDGKSLGYVDGTEVDYVREGLNSHFKFNNPNVSNTCGCGESFSVSK